MCFNRACRIVCYYIMEQLIIVLGEVSLKTKYLKYSIYFGVTGFELHSTREIADPVKFFSS